MRKYPISWVFQQARLNRIFPRQEDNFKRYYSDTINQNRLKMQFEQFDDKVKQAAEQHHPNYDEKAWTRMEKLLDQHLPQEGDRRRRFIFFILFSLLLIGGAAWFMM